MKTRELLSHRRAVEYPGRSRAKKPRPQSNSDAGGIPASSITDGVAPEGASTATAGASILDIPKSEKTKESKMAG